MLSIVPSVAGKRKTDIMFASQTGKNTTLGGLTAYRGQYMFLTLGRLSVAMLAGAWEGAEGGGIEKQAAAGMS